MNQRWVRTLVAGIAALGLALGGVACGGGDDDDRPRQEQRDDDGDDDDDDTSNRGQDDCEAEDFAEGDGAEDCFGIPGSRRHSRKPTPRVTTQKKTEKKTRRSR